MIKEKRIIKLGNYYTFKELIKSFTTGLIFFVIPSSLFILLFANIVVLYVPYLIYLLLVLYIIIILISLFSNKVLIETLINYQDKSLEINYKNMYYKLVILSAIDITIIFIIGYLIYLSYN